MAADDEQVLRPGIDGAIGVKSHEGVELGELQRVLIERVIDVGSRGPYLFHLAKIYHMVRANLGYICLSQWLVQFCISKPLIHPHRIEAIN